MPHLTEAVLESLWPQLQAPWDDKRAIKKITQDDGTSFLVIQFGWIIERLNTVLGLGHWRVVELDHSITTIDGGVEAVQHILFEIGNWHWTDDRGSVWECLAQVPHYGVYHAATAGDALKGALTNAIKKTVALMGPGLSLIKGIEDDDVPTRFVELTLTLQSGTTRHNSDNLLEFTGQGEDLQQRRWILHAEGTLAQQLLERLKTACTLRGMQSGDATRLDVTEIIPVANHASMTETTDIPAPASSSASAPSPDSSPTAAQEDQAESPHSITTTQSASVDVSTDRAQKIRDAQHQAQQAGLDIAKLRAHFAPDNIWKNETDVQNYYIALITLTALCTNAPETLSTRITKWSAYETLVKALTAYGWNADDALAPLVAEMAPDSTVTELPPAAYQKAAHSLTLMVQQHIAA
jgi:hypothetical protein